MALLLTCGDGEERGEVYGCAADRQQASIVFEVAADMVRMCPALNKRVKILASQKRIVYQSTNSFYQVLSAEAYSKHGFNIHGVVFDELHTQPNRKLFDVMTKGSGDARTQPLYFLITTAGTDTNSICYETHQKAKDIIEGRKIDPTFYPVIYGAEETDDWTDPKVWKKNDRWWMVVGAQTKELKGNVAIFESNDLKKWDYRGNLLDTSMDWGYMCECPDVMDIEQQFLVVSCQKETGCKGIVFSGRMDYAEAKFQLQDEGNLLDEGLDFYAPQSFADESGRCILIGWLGAGELEYQMSQPTVEEGWLHALTIPRELFIQNGKLHQRPVKEFERIRRHERVIEAEGYTFIDQETWSVELLAEQLSSQKISFNFGNVLKIYFDCKFEQERR